tara:strand:+ start:100 stop:438 length:339 start_codon:yes stop_codon:yes gene_type:complete
MEKETILYFADGALGAVDSAGGYKASDFMGLDISGSNTARFYFKGATNVASTNGGSDTITVTYSGTFKDLAIAVAGAINSKKAFYTMADDLNDVYFSYPGGTLSGTPTVTQA